MKNWNNPELEELAISATAQGRKIQFSFDEIRVDQNDNWWASFQSGNTPTTPVGPIIVPGQN